MNKQHGRLAPESNRPVSGIQSLPSPTLWRKANTEQAAAAKATHRTWPHRGNHWRSVRAGAAVLCSVTHITMKFKKAVKPSFPLLKITVCCWKQC